LTAALADESTATIILEAEGDDSGYRRDQSYLVEAEDGTRYKVVWCAGSVLWRLGDTAILYGTNHTYASIDETEQTSLDDATDADPD
jgi:hypothetical protein